MVIGFSMKLINMFLLAPKYSLALTHSARFAKKEDDEYNLKSRAAPGSDFYVFYAHRIVIG